VDNLDRLLLDRLLKEAMRRQDPPVGFEARVLGMTRRRTTSWKPWLAIAATLIIGGGLGWQVDQERRDRVQGEAAKAKLELALRITSAKLQKIQKTIEARNQGI